ncbi:hypothetical protein [Chryseobacterium lathyri]|uniref:hypothetical protein n=1 Tax=Chryseobacterium lathyri TaxID=395933 RepID=UPI00278A3366|nr:hypothetical protein [Chryseobacterium lathyri]MDQ0064635.1 hypothetical protein [Chryseobacterium lathyri]
MGQIHYANYSEDPFFSYYKNIIMYSFVVFGTYIMAIQISMCNYFLYSLDKILHEGY